MISGFLPFQSDIYSERVEVDSAYTSLKLKLQDVQSSLFDLTKKTDRFREIFLADLNIDVEDAQFSLVEASGNILEIIFASIRTNTQIEAVARIFKFIESAGSTPDAMTLVKLQQEKQAFTEMLLFKTGTSVGAVSFDGIGLNDAISGGTYTGSGFPEYKVVIDLAAGTDTFEWFKDGVSQATGVSITGASQTLSDGVTITFGAITGHTLGENWTFNIKSNAITNSGDIVTMHFSLIGGYAIDVTGEAIYQEIIKATVLGLLGYDLSDSQDYSWITLQLDVIPSPTEFQLIADTTGSQARKDKVDQIFDVLKAGTFNRYRFLLTALDKL